MNIVSITHLVNNTNPNPCHLHLTPGTTYTGRQLINLFRTQNPNQGNFTVIRLSQVTNPAVVLRQEIIINQTFVLKFKANCFYIKQGVNRNGTPKWRRFGAKIEFI